MKKNENIFISLQIQKDQESKKLLLSVQFDKNAPNFSTETHTIIWYPTCEEIDFITEAFELFGWAESPEKVIEEPQNTTTSPEEITMNYSHRSSEIRIAPLEDDLAAIEVTADLESSSTKNEENDEKIFVQTDVKKIDEILKRKKLIVKEDYVTESGEKKFIDRMLKQKKKK